MRVTPGFRGPRRWWLTGAALVVYLAFMFPLCGQGKAAPQDNATAPGSGTGAEQTQTPSRRLNGTLPENNRIQETKVIDGHILINPYAVVDEPGPPRGRFQKLHQERLWAITELDQQRSELSSLVGESHHRPVPVPVVSEADYNARVSDIDSKIRTYEARQNDGSLTETEKSEAHAQLLDLTRQKARAALELITYRDNQQQQAAYNDVLSREEAAKSITADTLSYLSKIDESISELIMSSDAERFFRLEMGVGFLALVTLLIVCFFIFGSRSGSMKEIFKDDRGLQFITLFSLVIAITMFGLLNILEGKELAALLGGLSGYILGRSNLGAGDGHHTDKPGGSGTSGGAGAPGGVATGG